MKKFIAFLVVAMIAIISSPVAGAATQSYDGYVIKPPGSDAVSVAISVDFMEKASNYIMCSLPEFDFLLSYPDLLYRAEPFIQEPISAIMTDAPTVLQWPGIENGTLSYTLRQPIYLTGLYTIWYASNDY